MDLKDKWKSFGKNTGKAFSNLGKTIGKTAKVVFNDEDNNIDADGDTELGNAWRETGKSFGRAGKSLGKAAQGTAQEVFDEDEESSQNKRIILLNGPSSSGKTTLASLLQIMIQEKRNEHYRVLSIDDFMKISTSETIYEDDVYDASFAMNQRIIDDIKDCPGIIIVHVITSERIFNELKRILEPYKLLLVHVDCPLEELKKREIDRGDRCIGSAESSYTYLYPQNGYDLTVNTHTNTTKECAELIYKRI